MGQPFHLTKGSITIAVADWLAHLSIDYAKMGKTQRHAEACQLVQEFLAALPCEHEATIQDLKRQAGNWKVLAALGQDPDHLEGLGEL
jgi:hypothetical protein